MKRLTLTPLYLQNPSHVTDRMLVLFLMRRLLMDGLIHLVQFGGFSIVAYGVFSMTFSLAL